MHYYNNSDTPQWYETLPILVWYNQRHLSGTFKGFLLYHHASTTLRMIVNPYWFNNKFIQLPSVIMLPCCTTKTIRTSMTAFIDVTLYLEYNILVQKHLFLFKYCLATQNKSEDLLREGIKAVCFLGVGEGYSHSRGERRVEDHSGTLKPWRQVYCGYRADALSVQDDILRTDAIPESTHASVRYRTQK